MRSRNRRALQLFDDIEQRVRALAVPGDAAPGDALPGGDEPAEGCVVDRFHFVPQLRERPSSQHPQHAGVGPLAVCAARAKLAFEQPPFRREAHQQVFRGVGREAVPRRKIGGRKWRVGPGVAEREVAERIGHWFEQGFGQARRQRHSEAVA